MNCGYVGAAGHGMDDTAGLVKVALEGMMENLKENIFQIGSYPALLQEI